jgi:acetyl/propionyl-CoA carboxylase alpha subunit
MENAELLRQARNIMLKLHKAMLDLEREMYEGIHGLQTATEFLNLLLEDEDFAWLRKFSMLIVEIDEMFASKEGFTQELVDANLLKVRELAAMAETDEYFKAKYQFSIQRDPNAAGLHSELKTLLSEPSA